MEQMCLALSKGKERGDVYLRPASLTFEGFYFASPAASKQWKITEE